MLQFSDRSGEATATSSLPLVSSVSCKQQKKTRWGRCALPSCTGRAFRPIMGSRGPFLVCSRRNCQGKRHLMEAEWKKLPKRCWNCGLCHGAKCLCGEIFLVFHSSLQPAAVQGHWPARRRWMFRGLRQSKIAKESVQGMMSR